jgi:F-type H+-transporting ATPase subunit gamma
MASLRDIRKRIRSVKNTQQITKAMKMVAAAKLRRAQEAILAARPYAQLLDQSLAELTGGGDEVVHPLLTARPNPKRVELVLLTSDRGLAGGFNANVIRRASRFLYENEKTFQSISLVTIGRKGNEFFKRRGLQIRKDYPGLYSRLSYATAQGVAEELSARFLSGEVDAVYLIYNEFLSAISQRVNLAPMLPLSAPAAAGTKGPRQDFIYEPSRAAVLEQLVPKALAIKVYRGLLESVASEHGARMSAMENATSNASDAIGRLTLTYNRTRQAVITKELMEIVSGAEALK